MGGALILSNATNDFSGNITVSSGTAALATLKLGASNMLPDGAGKGNVILNAAISTSNSTLDLGGFNETINGLSSTLSGSATAANARVTNTGLADSTLALGSNNATPAFNGTITDGATNKVVITKTGTGSQTFEAANT